MNRFLAEFDAYTERTDDWRKSKIKDKEAKVAAMVSVLMTHRCCANFEGRCNQDFPAMLSNVFGALDYDDLHAGLTEKLKKACLLESRLDCWRRFEDAKLFIHSIQQSADPTKHQALHPDHVLP
jgi:hypothetical protein